MTLWSDFLRRLMLTATLSSAATAAAEPPAEVAEPPAAEIGEQVPSSSGKASGPKA